jgi:tetratricopeptide (TPR) repeat protein
MGELEQAARQMVAANPARPAWRAALATALAESGRLEDARAEFDVAAAHAFEDLPWDGDWLTAMSLLCDLAVAIEDTERAELLYEALRPYAQSTVVAGIGAACLGSVARHLGKLASMLGREREAAEHFEDALRVNGALRAPGLLAHTQLDYAAALGTGARAEAMIAEATETAQRLGLAAIARRSARPVAG